MIKLKEKIDKPVKNVVLDILDYSDKEAHGLSIFSLKIPKNSDISSYASKNKPETTNLEKYVIVHNYHSEHSSIINPKDPRYLNASAEIAEIEADRKDLNTTNLKWKEAYRTHKGHEKGYAKLEKLLFGKEVEEDDIKDEIKKEKIEDKEPEKKKIIDEKKQKYKK